MSFQNKLQTVSATLFNNLQSSEMFDHEASDNSQKQLKVSPLLELRTSTYAAKALFKLQF